MMIATGRDEHSVARGDVVRGSRRMIENIRSGNVGTQGVRVRRESGLKCTGNTAQRIARILRWDRLVNMIIQGIGRAVCRSHVGLRRVGGELKKMDIARRGFVGLRLGLFRGGRRGRGRGDGVHLLVIEMLHQTPLQFFVGQRRLRLILRFAFRRRLCSSRRNDR